MTTEARISVPLLDLKAQYQSIRGEVQEAIDRVVESQGFILGQEVVSLERRIADYSQAAFGVGVSSGTDALLVSLMAIGIQPGDEVITTPFTFFATAGCISRLGARPVFVDIRPSDFNIDPNLIEQAVTPRTKAIIPVHLFGQVAEMDPIMEIANRHGLIVIEDAAQAIGAEYHGRRAGSIGQIGCFSFFPSKNLGGFGDGGMVVTSDPALAERLSILRAHGSKPKYYHSVVGGNFRLDALQAAVLNVKLTHLDDWTSGRQRNAARYRELLTGIVGLELPTELPGRRHIYNQFVLRTSRRDEIMDALKRAEIGCEIYYPLSLHQQECFADLGYRQGDFPESEAAAAESVAIPIYPELTPMQQEAVASAVRRALE